MADRVDARIKLGGHVPADEAPRLVELILQEALGPDWDQRFDDPDEVIDHLREGTGGVVLYGQQVASGEFSELQAFCARVGLTYVLTYDGFGGEWGPGRRIRRPGDAGEGLTCPLSEDGGAACISAAMIRGLKLADVPAILSVLERFDAEATPPLTIGT